jgi:hypothetical protein
VISGLIQIENKTCARAAQRKGDRADGGLVVPLVVLFSMVNLTSCPFFMFVFCMALQHSEKIVIPTHIN